MEKKTHWCTQQLPKHADNGGNANEITVAARKPPRNGELTRRGDFKMIRRFRSGTKEAREPPPRGDDDSRARKARDRRSHYCRSRIKITCTSYNVILINENGIRFPGTEPNTRAVIIARKRPIKRERWVTTRSYNNILCYVYTYILNGDGAGEKKKEKKKEENATTYRGYRGGGVGTAEWKPFIFNLGETTTRAHFDARAP